MKAPFRSVESVSVDHEIHMLTAMQTPLTSEREIMTRSTLSYPLSRFFFRFPIFATNLICGRSQLPGSRHADVCLDNFFSNKTDKDVDDIMWLYRSERHMRHPKCMQSIVESATFVDEAMISRARVDEAMNTKSMSGSLG
jgi:hypothetical protein